MPMTAPRVKTFSAWLLAALLTGLLSLGLATWLFQKKASSAPTVSTPLTPPTAPVPASPPPRTTPPPPLTEYRGRRIAPTMSYHGGGSWLLRRVREQEENAERMITELRLQPGQTVCDLGSGNGYHTLKMATLVAPTGKVIAVDIQPEMLAELTSRAAADQVKNIETVLGDVHDPRLAPQSCDLILLVDTYHEFSHPEHLLRAMHAALKPDGLVALVEYKGEDPSIPIKPEHKMTKAQIRAEWEPMGFQIAREYDDLPWQHLIFLGKK
jgi:ubiquinone/menaquinone biosynthesis C-methylase UbiE